MHTIHINYLDGKTNIIKRTYPEFWTFQLSFLQKNPSEAGYKNEYRIIPFLTPPIPKESVQGAQQRRIELNRYFFELVELPRYLLQSSFVTTFMEPRHGDDSNISINVDAGDSLLDLLEDYSDQKDDLVIKLVLGTEIIKWKVDSSISFNDLIKQSQAKLGFQFESLMYCDERETIVPLQGDSDLGLLAKLKKLRFFVA